MLEGGQSICALNKDRDEVERECSGAGRVRKELLALLALLAGLFSSLPLSFS